MIPIAIPLFFRSTFSSEPQKLSMQSVFPHNIDLACIQRFCDGPSEFLPQSDPGIFAGCGYHGMGFRFRKPDLTTLIHFLKLTSHAVQTCPLYTHPALAG